MNFNYIELLKFKEKIISIINESELPAIIIYEILNGIALQAKVQIDDAVIKELTTEQNTEKKEE